MHKKPLFLFIMSVALLVMAFGVHAQSDYTQAPILQAMVDSGELPPLAERLPAEPPVIEPVEEIGQYGGIIRVATDSPSSYLDAWWVTSLEGMMRIGPGASGSFPNVAREWTLDPDGTGIEIQLVEGIRWSDGEPFTADDIVFWYEDFLLNPDLTPVVAANWVVDGEVMELTKIDDYTFRLDFAGPYLNILNVLSHAPGTNLTSYPAHYLKQFHASYADADELQAKVEEAGVESWVTLFQNVTAASIGVSLRPGIPTIQPFVLQEASASLFTFERNPYYWKVDTAGQQLPYADGIEVIVTASREVTTAQTVAGNYDLASHTTDISNISLYTENAETGDYRVLLWPQAATIFMQVNQTSEDPGLREVFQNVNFRRALSLAINREEINQVTAFGLGRSEQVTVVPESVYFSPEFVTSYSDYDVEQANALLDEMGLTERDDRGIRLRPDGEPLQFTMTIVEIGQYGQIAELLVGYFEDIGVDMDFVQISNDLAQQRLPANQADASMWSAAGLTDSQFINWPMWYAPIRTGWETAAWSPWARWYMTGGAEGEEPPDNIKHVQDLFDALKLAPNPETAQEIGQELMQIQADNLWSIGILAYAPKPVIVKNRLRNVPEVGLWGWDTVLMYAYHPEQFFIAE